MLLATSNSCKAQNTYFPELREILWTCMAAADFTVWVRTEGSELKNTIRTDEGKPGYLVFLNGAKVVETFRGTAPDWLEFSEVQEAPSRGRPPGEYIACLSRQQDQKGLALTFENGAIFPVQDQLLRDAREFSGTKN